jgi:hypothetical protein
MKRNFRKVPIKNLEKKFSIPSKASGLPDAPRALLLK